MLKELKECINIWKLTNELLDQSYSLELLIRVFIVSALLQQLLMILVDLDDGLIQRTFLVHLWLSLHFFEHLVLEVLSRCVKPIEFL